MLLKLLLSLWQEQLQFEQLKDSLAPSFYLYASALSTILDMYLSSTMDTPQLFTPSTLFNKNSVQKSKCLYIRSHLLVDLDTSRLQKELMSSLPTAMKL
jgi:hypothetical protein